MATGTAIVDFGAFPGKSDAAVTVTSAGILSTSLVEAWLFGSTSDHSEDEHFIEPLRVFAGSINEGASTFVIRIRNDNQVSPRKGDPGEGQGTRIYGQWKVGWAWV